MVSSNNPPLLVKKIEYRGWKDCYLISNDFARIIINASAGGRIMVYERHGINLIYEDSSQDGKLLTSYLAEGFDPDGGRFDYGQELITRDIHAQTYMGSWTAKISGQLSLEITSQPDHRLGILSTRVFSLDLNSPGLKITQTMRNISGSETSYFFWGRTLVKPGGKLFIPLNPESRFPEKWGRYIWGMPVIFESDPGDPGVKVKDLIFSLVPAKARNQKYGTDSHAGWMAYGIDGKLFVKKYGFSETQEYAEHYGQTNVFYTNRTLFAEMEPISPLARLNPGEEYSYTEDWYILDYEPALSVDFDVVDAVSFTIKQTHQ